MFWCHSPGRTLALITTRNSSTPKFINLATIFLTAFSDPSSSHSVTQRYGSWGSASISRLVTTAPLSPSPLWPSSLSHSVKTLPPTFPLGLVNVLNSLTSSPVHHTIQDAISTAVWPHLTCWRYDREVKARHTLGPLRTHGLQLSRALSAARGPSTSFYSGLSLLTTAAISNTPCSFILTIGNLHS